MIPIEDLTDVTPEIEVTDEDEDDEDDEDPPKSSKWPFELGKFFQFKRAMPT